MVNASAAFKKEEKTLPFDGGSEYWCEKLVYSFGGYLKNTGYENEWMAEPGKSDDS